MNNHIKCPHCNKEFEMSQAFKHEIEEQIRMSSDSKHKEELEKLKKAAEESLLKQKEEMEALKKAAFAEAQKKASEDIEMKMKDAQNEKEELKLKNKELMDQLLSLNKSLRNMQDLAEKQSLENQKMLSLEREKMKEEISKFETEKAHLKEAEYQKKIADMQKLLEDAQRKGSQGSQQLQGEVLELDLEAQLKEAYPNDEFLPVPKGVEGADIWQKVRNKHGQVAGSIVWETKRTKAWSPSWLAKLREDTRTVNGSISLLVTQVFPDDIKHFGFLNGVWICSFDHAVSVAGMLRTSLLQIAIAKTSAAHKDEKLQLMYEYITSEAFRHKFEAHFESVKELKADLEAEKRSTERMWKKREMQINRLDRSASQMFGEFQGIVGTALPSIKALEEGETETHDTLSDNSHIPFD